MIYSGDNNGQRPLVNISRVANGWMVIVHHYNRDKETSPETLAKRDAERQQEIIDRKEREKKRIVREMTLQLANMAIIGEAAGKAQHKGIENEIESWKSDDEEEEADEDSEKGAFQKIEAIAEKIASESAAAPSNGLLGAIESFAVGAGLFSSVETHIFTEREKMAKFVMEMLQPIQE